MGAAVLFSRQFRRTPGLAPPNEDQVPTAGDAALVPWPIRISLPAMEGYRGHTYALDVLS
jgi:hypothetical protein